MRHGKESQEECFACAGPVPCAVAYTHNSNHFQAMSAVVATSDGVKGVVHFIKANLWNTVTCMSSVTCCWIVPSGLTLTLSIT